MRVLFVRHGETDWNAAGMLQGMTDVPLNGRGRRQVEATAARLATELTGDVTVVSSPLERAHASALLLADRLEVPVATDRRLRERAYGVWEGCTMAEREARWPAEVERWRTVGEPRIDGYEPNAQVATRMAEATEEHAERAAGTVVLVSHGSAIRMGLTRLLGLPLDGRALSGIGNAAWSRVRRRGYEWTLERHHVTPGPVD